MLLWVKSWLYRLFETKEQKADRMLLDEFVSVWEKRIEQRMSPDFDWDTMTHPDDEDYCDDDEILQELI
tara:strand:- start:691 stop:897 length:207 start_codon:yes stop_codon:yes gene_type:complete